MWALFYANLHPTHTHTHTHTHLPLFLHSAPLQQLSTLSSAPEQYVSPNNGARKNARKSKPYFVKSGLSQITLSDVQFDELKGVYERCSINEVFILPILGSPNFAVCVGVCVWGGVGAGV